MLGSATVAATIMADPLAGAMALMFMVLRCCVSGGGGT